MLVMSDFCFQAAKVMVLLQKLTDIFKHHQFHLQMRQVFYTVLHFFKILLIMNSFFPFVCIKEKNSNERKLACLVFLPRQCMKGW